MKKILVPTDFSENAFNALKYAVQLFLADECTFYLMHTYTPPVYQSEYLLHSPSQFGLGDTYRNNAKENLKKVQERIEKLFKNSEHHFMAHTAFNTLVGEILETVEKEQIDLIVMGTQGATGAEEILFGSHTVHVIKKVKCPVIAVPADYTYEKPKEILFPTDYEVDYKKEQINELLDIGLKQNVKINILHVSPGHDLTSGQKINKAVLVQGLKGTDHVFHDVPDAEIITAINDFQKRRPIHLLAMIRNKHRFFERLFVEPVIKKIAFHVKIPFMVIPHLADDRIF